MARRRNVPTEDEDSFTALLNGAEPVTRGRSPRADPGDQAATERFGWGAAAAPAAQAAPGSGPGPGATASPGAPAHPGYGGYTTAVEPVPETILLRTRPHARRLTIPVLILFATVTALGWFGGRFPEEWQNITALAGAGALVFFGTLLPFIAWLGHRYTITSRRIIARRGLFVGDRQDLYLARVTDIRVRRTPLQAAFATGNVRVVAGPDLTVVLHDVPSARLVAELLGDLTEHPVPPLPYS
ncbi:PH domain-containing protein [Herbiconiux sp.]|uniref:PH domain-containing protein n=1 Tax=Herbiconiux sp. TaxID=1871186 RepID=UPI0025BFB455|nr:PH domain-containing protein [Herbiconiux sp.]